MQHRLLEIIECPYDGGHPLRLRAGKIVRRKTLPDRPLCLNCSTFCHRTGSPVVDRSDCADCLDERIESGILSCPRCGRDYPVEGFIPSLLPDELAGASSEGVREWRDKRSEMAKRDEESQIYDALYSEALFGREIRRLVGFLKPDPADLILDAGCGTGRVTRSVLAWAGEVIGVDYSLSSLHYFLNGANQADLSRLHLIQADLSMLPLTSGAVHKTLSSSVLCFLPGADERARGFAELHRTLVPGGDLVLSVYNFSALKRLMGILGRTSVGNKEGYQSEGKIRYYNFEARELLALLSDHYRIIATAGANYRLPHISRLGPRAAFLTDWLLSGLPFSMRLLAREITVHCVKR